MSASLPSGLLPLLLLLLLAVQSVTASMALSPQCNMAGVLNSTSKTCVCSSLTWTGPYCGQLNLLPAQGNGMALASPGNASSWGGSVAEEDGVFHMLASRMSFHCGLDSWEHNSRIIRATASSPEGPYTQVEDVVPIWSHNPTLHFDPFHKQWVVFHIGNGVIHDNLQPLKCSNGTTPNPPLEVRTTADPPTTVGADLGTPNVAMTPSLASGTWKLVNGSNAWSFNNPAAMFHSNGSVLMVYKVACDFNTTGFCRQFAVATANAWDGPYVSQGLMPVYGEDAYIWRGPEDGIYRLVYQGGNYDGVPPCSPGNHWHTAYSLDGLNWTPFCDGRNAMPPTIGTEGGKGPVLTLSRRERHQLLMDSTGRPAYLFNGAQPNPTVDDYTFTSVQPIQT